MAHVLWLESGYHFTAVDGKREGVDINSEQNTTKMGRRRQLAPIAGQSGLRPGGGRAELPPEDVLEVGDMSLGNILNGAEPGVLGSQLCRWRQSNTTINNTMATTTGCHRHRQWKKRMPVIATRALDRFNRCRTAPSIEPFRPTHGERTIHRPIGLLIAWMGKGQRTEQGQRTETPSLCDGIHPNVLDIAVQAGASKVS